MRTVLLVVWMLLVIPSPTFGEDYVAPAIVVSGDATEVITRKWVMEKYRQLKPLCIVEAQAQTTIDPEGNETGKSIQDERYVRCMAKAFAPYKLAVMKDIPTELSSTK